MKAYIHLLAIISSVLLQHHLVSAKDAVKWGLATNKLQMSITLADGNTNVVAGKDYSLEIRYRNLSAGETYMVYQVNGTIYDPTYSFEIVSPSGHDVSPETRKLKPGDSGAVRPIGPNQIVNIRFDLGKLCRLDELGTYKIIAEKRHVYSIHHSFTAVSNPLFVKVIRAK